MIEFIGGGLVLVVLIATYVMGYLDGRKAENRHRLTQEYLAQCEAQQ